MLRERVRQFQPECFRDSIVICNKGQVIIRRKTKKSQVQFFFLLPLPSVYLE